MFKPSDDLRRTRKGIGAENMHAVPFDPRSAGGAASRDCDRVCRLSVINAFQYFGNDIIAASN